jgi:hypothetical protein
MFATLCETAQAQLKHVSRAVQMNVHMFNISFSYRQETPGSDYALSMALQFHGGPKEVCIQSSNVPAFWVPLGTCQLLLHHVNMRRFDMKVEYSCLLVYC